MRVGIVLKKYRLMNEWSLRDMAKQIGISAATLMRVEMGHVPDGNTLKLILYFLMIPENVKAQP